ncbi:MAG: rod shape-determining protein MreC, partial [Candidatus Omnitrophica bacterium]|nr:rod shape-determining protein MreC [Candidatus Omnitrophota bacterium]
MSLMSFGTSSVAVARWPVDEAGRLLSYRQTYQDYQQMKREVGGLKARLAALEENGAANKRFSRLLDLRNRLGYATEAALVVARDPASWNSSLMINKGKSSGIHPGMAVVNATGVVGKVAEVAKDVSKVILITDSGFSVAVVNQRSRESSLLGGSLSGDCRLYYLPDDADIRVGDEIVTSMLSSVFPEGLRVGTVSEVFPGEKGTPPRAQVSPAVELSKV